MSKTYTWETLPERERIVEFFRRYFALQQELGVRCDCGEYLHLIGGKCPTNFEFSCFIPDPDEPMYCELYIRCRYFSGKGDIKATIHADGTVTDVSGKIEVEE